MEGVGNLVSSPLLGSCMLSKSEVVGKPGLCEPIICVWRLNYSLEQHNQLDCSSTNRDSTYICPTFCEEPVALAIGELVTRERRIRLEWVAGEFLHYLNLGSVDLDLAGMCTVSGIFRISATNVGDLQHHV